MADPRGRGPNTQCGSLDTHLTGLLRVLTLNYMVQYCPSRPTVGESFAALADATRRGVVERLTESDASITELAETFDLTLTGLRKHVGILEQAGLVVTEKVGRVRICRLGSDRLDEAAAWIERYRQQWDARFDQLERVVHHQRTEQIDGLNTTT